MRIRIYYHHTDAGGVVYYARYLDFLENARTEYLEKKGISVKVLLERGVMFVVAHQEIDYKLPAFYGDTLDIETHVNAASNVRIDFEYEIKNQDNKVLTGAKTTLVCVDKNLKPQPIPPDIRKFILEKE